MNILHHLSFAVTDLTRSAAFYDAVLATLDYRRVWEDATFIGYGVNDGEDIFALKLRPANAGVPGDGFHVAFSAPTREAVLQFHEAALAQGGIDNGGVGLHPEYGPDYFAAFVIDPDGYRIEAVILGAHDSTSSPDWCVDIIRGNDVTPTQEQFINHWDKHFFGESTVAKGVAKAPVHWRLFLRNAERLLSHVAITEMTVELDGEHQTCGAIGGLFAPPEVQGKGHASALMDRAEAFIFSELALTTAILFCLPELVPFYAKRGWSLVEQPVTLEQVGQVVTWGAAVMLLFAEKSQHGCHLVHIPLSSSQTCELSNELQDATKQISAATTPDRR